jgi:hypothetical protein
MRSLRWVAVLTILALCGASSHADGIDPKVIIQKGGGSIPITLTNPNPIVTATAVANTGQCFYADSSACVQDVFQNQTGVTIKSLTIAITDIAGLTFSCGASSDLIYFNSCAATDVSGVTDVFFSNTPGSPFHGVDPAVRKCADDDQHNTMKGWTKKSDNDDDCENKWVGGEFSVDIEGKDLPAGTSITTQTVTTPEPAAGLMVLFTALAFGLFKLVRRAA